MGTIADGSVSLTCIRCPRGCQLTATVEGGSVASVVGNACPRGEKYARAEVVAPMRCVTTTVTLDGSATHRTLPVRTSADVPKSKVLDVVRALADVHAFAPVAIGDVVARNVADTGVDVIATANRPS